MLDILRFKGFDPVEFQALLVARWKLLQAGLAFKVGNENGELTGSGDAFTACMDLLIMAFNLEKTKH